MEGQLEQFNGASLDIEGWFARYGYSENNRPLLVNDVSVNNSVNVHFGDRTYYNGPVVIKQYILTGEDEGVEGELEKVVIDESDDEEPLTKDDAAVNVAKDLQQIAAVAEEAEYKVVGNHVTVNASHGCKELEDLNKIIEGNPPVVRVTDSNDVHFGKQVHYKGPVTIEKVVCSKTQIDFHALESKMWLNESTGASSKQLTLVSRIEWLARAPVEGIYDMIHPVPYVIVNHTATTNCKSRLECIHYVRSFQTFHMETRQWFDVGYNFLVGADGNVYEGRGWHKVGAHTKFYNESSIGIAFIGTFCHVAATKQQIAGFMRIVREGVRKGYIAKDYKLLAARQLRPTESPGKALYEQMKNWPHWYRTLEITEL